MRICCIQKIIDLIRRKKKKKEITPERQMNIVDITNAYLVNWMHCSRHLLTDMNLKSSFKPAERREVCERDFTDYSRLKNVIKARMNDVQKGNDDIWQSFIVDKHKELYDFISIDDDINAINTFNNMFNNDLSKGFEFNFTEEFYKENKQVLLASHLSCMSTLLSFAEYLGAIPIENVEQAVYGEFLTKEPDEILDLVESKLRRTVKFAPEKLGLYSVQSSRGAFTNREIIYLYVANKIKEICKDIENPRICEIGGGCGYLAYQLDRIGIKDVTIVDIPSTSNVSAWFLMKNLPNRNFLFETDDNVWTDKESIKLVSPTSLHTHKCEGICYDLIVNVDSFPEINKDVLNGYIDYIKKHSKYFYSINQEAKGKMWELETCQNVVSEVLPDEFIRLSRNLFWLRPGYAEELYKINKEE